MKSFIPAGMVAVPMRVNQREGRVLADVPDGLKNARNRWGITGIDENVALRPGLQGHIPTLALKQIHVAVESSYLDGRDCSAGVGLRCAAGCRRCLCMCGAGKHCRRSGRDPYLQKVAAIHCFKHVASFAQRSSEPPNGLKTSSSRAA